MIVVQEVEKSCNSWISRLGYSVGGGSEFCDRTPIEILIRVKIWLVEDIAWSKRTKVIKSRSGI